MFDSLQTRLGTVFDRLRGRGALSEADVETALGEVRSVLWMRTKLYQMAYSATMYSWFCSFLLKAFVSRVNRRIAETLPYRDVADHRGNPNCGCRPDPAESDPAATRGKLAPRRAPASSSRSRARCIGAATVLRRSSVFPISNTNSASAIASFAGRESRSARWPVQAPRRRLTDIPWAARCRSIRWWLSRWCSSAWRYSFPARSARDSRVFR